MERSCDVCGTSYVAKRRTSRYCSERCRKRAQRVGVRPAYTRAEAVEDVAAECELLPVDLVVLEERHPVGEDEEVDEVLAGLAAHLLSLQRLLGLLRSEGWS